MSYPINITIPASGNNPSNDQQPIMQNFVNIAGYLGVDHTAPGTGMVNQAGQHNQVTFTANQTAPSIANGVSDLYANLVGANSQLFFQNLLGSVQMTGLNISGSGNDFGIQTPWGLKFCYGNPAVNGNRTGNYAIGFTFLPTILLVSSNSTNPTHTSVANNLSTTQYQLFNTGGNFTVFYLAIGV